MCVLAPHQESDMGEGAGAINRRSVGRSRGIKMRAEEKRRRRGDGGRREDVFFSRKHAGIAGVAQPTKWEGEGGE